jgi:hypothetical protein
LVKAIRFRDVDMKKMVRMLLSHYDRLGFIAAIFWLSFVIGTIAIPFLIIQNLLIYFLFIEFHSAGYISGFLLLPVIIYLSPTGWAAGFLLTERMWMFVGIHKILRWEPHHIRRIIGRLVSESK